MTAVGIGFAVAFGFFLGFGLGFGLASVLMAAVETEQEIEAMRRRHIEHITAWLETKQEELDQAA